MQKFTMNVRYDLTGAIVVVSMGTVLSGYIPSDKWEQNVLVEDYHPQLDIIVSDRMIIERRPGTNRCADTTITTRQEKHIRVLILPEYLARPCANWFDNDRHRGRQRPKPGHIVLPESLWVCTRQGPRGGFAAPPSPESYDRACVWLVVEEALGFSEGTYGWGATRWFHHDHFVIFHDESTDAMPEMLSAAFTALPEDFRGGHVLQGWWSVLMNLNPKDIQKSIAFLLAKQEQVPLINDPRELI